MKLFELFATLSLQTSDFDSSVEKATKKGEELSGSLEGVIARGTAAGQAMYDFGRSAVSALFNAGRDLVETAAEVQAENAAFEATFGTLQEAAKKSFSTIGAETNIVASRLKTVGTKAFSQFKGSGMEASEAMEHMDTYMRLAADAAAYYDMSLSEVDTRLRSFIRGNTEAGDAIGLFTSATQRDDKALELYGKKWLDLNEAQRQTLMLRVIEEIYKQGNVLGQASREADSYQNTLDNLNEVWRQVKATLGGPILEAIIPAIEAFAKFLQDNPEMVQKLADAVGEIADVTFSALMGVLEYLSNHGPTIANTVWSIAAGVKNLAMSLGIIPNETAGMSSKDASIYDYNKTARDNNKWYPENPMLLYEDSPQDWDPERESIFDYMARFSRLGGGSNATGLDYVPYDGFRSVLHRGEMILSASDADALRGGIATGGMDYTRLAGAIASAMAGMTVQMDGQTVGRLVAPTVGREMRREAQSKRYTT